MKIHLQSDIHTEMGAWIGSNVPSDVVICAGDIGTARDLSKIKRYFDDIKKTTKHIIWVLGNHEFYNSDYQTTLAKMYEFAVNEGIHLLDEALGTQNLEIDGITFWGSTLWTDLKKADWLVKQKVGCGINDFYIISKGKFTPQDSIDINNRTREKINWDADVVITHHHPLLREHRYFPLNDITYGFCNTGLEQQIHDSKVKLWVFGHTHDSTNEDINGTRVISNQQGYQKRSYQTGITRYEDDKFDPKLIIEVN